MYKMLIADDEAMERRAFKAIVEKDIELISEVIEAQNGNEAVQKAQLHKPDIIVMDVKMPGINGIEAIKKIKQSGIDAHMIVLTAYDDFNYIQEALKIGVDDYLLKPSRRIKIVDSLNKIIEIIKTERKKAGLNKTMLKKIEKISPVVENQLVLQVMFGGASGLELRSCLDFLGVVGTQGYVMIIGLIYDHNIDDNNTKHILIKDVYDFLYIYLHEKAIVAIGLPYSGNIAVIVFDREHSLDKELSNVLKEEFSRGFSIGAGDYFDSWPLMERSYYQALQALKSSLFGGEAYVSFLDETELSDYKMRYLAGKEEVLLQRFKKLNEKECFDTIDEMFLWVFKNLSMDFGVVKNYVMGIVALVIKTAAEMVIGKNMATTFLNRDYYGEISMINDLWNLKKWFEHTITEIIDAVKDTQQKKLMKVIEQAKAYIENNYPNELTLEVISEQINVSQTHFSRIFKLETGFNFVDYLTKVRLDKAIDLLKTTDMTIKQICFEVGFNDPNYFSKVFKKVLGVTPGEYKNNFE